MRLGIRHAVSGLVLASIFLAAGGVHALWWQTAVSNSRTLASTINEQIVFAVEKELASIADQARAAHTSIRTLFLQNVLETREADKREFVFLSQIQAHATLSWIAFGWPDGSFFASHRLGDRHLEMMEISAAEDRTKRRVDRYKVITGDIEFEERQFVLTDFRVTEQEWYRAGFTHDVPRWLPVTDHPIGMRPAIVFAGPIDVYQKREGVLAIMIEYARISRFLSKLRVGRTGAAFIIGRQGMTVASPDSMADENTTAAASEHPLRAVAHMALRNVGNAYDADFGPARSVRVEKDGSAHAVTLTPLVFPGWTLATVIPEAEFLGAVDMTIRRLLIGLAGLVVVAGIASAFLARRVVAAPLLKVTSELKKVERFDLDAVKHHPSRIVEIEDLSKTIADMASGLSAFRKYIPADLVRSLLGRGIAPEPGGTVRAMTVMFADIAGFTGLSERLGEDVIPLLSRYLDLMAREVSAHDGTIDKFIGDAVMAFWGAPSDNPDHAVDACRAALACQDALRSAKLVDDHGRPLRVRIGINSGDMLVGNIGSDVRLNYTVIGDAVNVASRLESANKSYGTDIILGERTRALAGDRIQVRELDSLMVYGRAGGQRIYELMALADGAEPPRFVALYEEGLAKYRARDFAGAVALFESVVAIRPDDRPAHQMIKRCHALLEEPPDETWQSVSTMKVK